MRHILHSFQIREKPSLRVPIEPNSDLSRLIPCGVIVTYLPSLEVASLSANNPVSNVPPRKIHVRLDVGTGSNRTNINRVCISLFPYLIYVIAINSFLHV